MAYASACAAKCSAVKRAPTFSSRSKIRRDRMHAREDSVLCETEANSESDRIGRAEREGIQVGYNDMAYLQILWSQNETRLLPNPLAQTATQTEAAPNRTCNRFTCKVSQGGAGCADCYDNGNVIANGVPNDTSQDYNIHEPGVISESTVDGNGTVFRPINDYFFYALQMPPQDVGTPQNLNSRKMKHSCVRSGCDTSYLHYGAAHTAREILLRRTRHRPRLTNAASISVLSHR